MAALSLGLSACNEGGDKKESKDDPTTEFPYEIMRKIHKHYFGYKPEFPLPVGGDEWYYGVERDDQSYYGYAYTLDNGEIGVNSIEDVYKAVLEEDGWQIDDTLYDDDGYYAYSFKVTMNDDHNSWVGVDSKGNTCTFTKVEE